LNELKQENEAILAATVVESVPVDTATVTNTSAAGEENGNDEEGEPDEGGGTAGAKKAKKKKKKKPAAAAATEEAKGKGTTTSATSNTNTPATTISARGRLVAERLRIQREEEERIRRLQEEEDRRIAELEAKEAEELRKKEEEKERKKQKQKEKIERQKMEGTYMTKAQKQKAKLAAERLEAMKAAGMLPTTALPTNENNSNTTPMSNPAKLYNKKHKQPPISKRKEELLLPPSQPTLQPDQIPQIEMPELQQQQQQQQETLVQDHIEETKEEDSVLDEWDAESFDSFDPNLAQLEAKLQQVNTNTTWGGGINVAKDNTQLGHQQDDEEEEDLIAAEKKQELERLRILGLEREKREKMEAEKRAAFLAEQEEFKRQEALVAQKKAEGKKRRMEQEQAHLAARTRDHLRCPVVVIMGHVDTGKTKLLDKIRHTNVQEGEAGGITQQIGATFFEKKTLEQQTSRLNKTEQVNLTIPGMLVIDTPGHESFSNLRSRGSSLCDIAILVVDLMHGLEPQTIESLNMLRSKGTPFVVALNKIDRCYAWVTCPDAPIREALEKQTESTVSEFRSRASQAKLELAQQGVNSNIYWEMGDDDWENSVCWTLA
jgi:translation initiation factor 5B